MSHTGPDYPTFGQFVEASKNIIAKIRGDTAITNACAARCGWVVWGFGQSVILPDDHPDDQPQPMMACDSPESLASCLECCCSESTPAMTATAGFDWTSLIAVLLPLILEWLKPKPKV